MPSPILKFKEICSRTEQSEARYTYHGQGNELRICCLKIAMMLNILTTKEKLSGMDFKTIKSISFFNGNERE